MINIVLPKKVTINTKKLAFACMADKSDGSMCALGQALNQAGVPVESLYKVYGPQQLAEEKGYLCKELLHKHDENSHKVGKSNLEAVKIWNGSDSRNFEKVKEGFSELGIEVEFIE